MVKRIVGVLVSISVLTAQVGAFSLLDEVKMDRWLILDIVYGTEDNIA
jgi:hypothetical protein